MKNNQKIIVFHKDFSINLVSESDLPNPKEIKFLLIPMVGFDTEGFFYIKSKDLFRFKRAIIEFQFNIEFYSDALKSLILPQYQNRFESTSIIETCNLLYSLFKYGMITSFENNYIREEIPCEIAIEPEYLKVEIFDEEDDLIMKADIDQFMNSAEKNNMMDSLLNKIFKTPKSFITIRNGHWSMIEKKKIGKDDLLGVPSSVTRTIVFVESSDYCDISQSVHGFSVEILIVDMEEYGYMINSGDLADRLAMDSCNGIMDTDIVPIKMVSYWEHDTNDILNFVSQLKGYAYILDELMNMAYRCLHINDDSNYNKIPSEAVTAPITVINNELLSMKLRNYSDFFVADSIISLTDYISIIHDLVEYM